MKQAQTGSLSGTRVFSLHLVILKAAYGLNKVMTRKRKKNKKNPLDPSIHHLPSAAELW